MGLSVRRTGIPVYQAYYQRFHRQIGAPGWRAASAV
jgi:hypothetical protein